MSERVDPIGLIGAWALLGGVNSITMDLLGRMSAVDTDWTTPAVLGGAAVGVTAWALLRHRDKWDPLVATATWTPVALGIPSLVAVGVVGTVAADDARVWWVAGMGVVGLSVWLRRGLSRQALAMAITRDFEGDPTWVHRLSETRLVPPSVRDHARYALALRQVREGDNDAALGLLTSIRATGIGPLATVLQALIQVAQGANGAAEELLRTLPPKRSRTLLRQTEAVRALMTLRSGSRPVLSEDAVPLSRALDAWWHWKRGDVEAVFDLLDATNRTSLRRNGMATLVPEVAELLAALPE